MSWKKCCSMANGLAFSLHLMKPKSSFHWTERLAQIWTNDWVSSDCNLWCIVNEGLRFQIIIPGIVIVVWWNEATCNLCVIVICQKVAPYNNTDVVYYSTLLQLHFYFCSVPGCWYFCCKNQHRGSESFWKSHSCYWREWWCHHDHLLWSYKSW